MGSLDSIESARKSTADDLWGIEILDEVKVEGDEVEEKLDAAGSKLYRSVAARLNDLSPERPDISYAVKEAARNMSAPTEADLRRLRKIGKDPLGRPQLVFNSHTRRCRQR